MRPSKTFRAAGAASALVLSLSACAAMLDRLESRGAVVATDAECPGLVATTTPWAMSTDPEHFAVPAVPPSLDRRVAVWKRIWGRLSARQHLVVDSDRPWLVWAEVDCRGVADSVCDDRLAAGRAEAASSRFASVDDDLLAAFDGNADLAESAQERVITIHGRRGDLKQAMRRASGELYEIEGLFAAAGVPRAFARVALLESGWQDEGVSAKGATGIFQFTTATAHDLLQVDDDVDERRDHRRTAAAAAVYLKQLHDRFGSWPLALTAYNTGPTRLQAVLQARQTRDLGVAADAGDLAGFGFEGQNYFAQVTAIAAVTADEVLAIEVHGGRAMQLGEPLSVMALSSCLGVDPAQLAAANPAWAEAVVGGERDVPAGHVVWVPGVDGSTRLVTR